MKTGLVSVSFRALTPEQIVPLCAQCRLDGIEWGGDVHIPLGDLPAAKRAARLTRDAGLQVFCYGSYVHMTTAERSLFPALLDTARSLGAPSIRVWAGREEDDSQAEIAESARMLCDMAKDVRISFEFHRGTLTHDAAGAVSLLKAIDRENAVCQWQPPVGLSDADCLAAIEAIRPWQGSVHVFSWSGTERLPLIAHRDSWVKYLCALRGDRTALLEFVQNDDPAQLVRDADSLREMIREAKV